MKIDQQSKERRRQPRFRLNLPALVVVKSGGILSSNILNIGVGGMAFHYSSNTHRSISAGSLDLLAADFVKLIRLSCLRFTTVYDRPSPDSSDLNRAMRLQGVKFEELSEEQHAQMHNVLRYYATATNQRSYARKWLD